MSSDRKAMWEHDQRLSQLCCCYHPRHVKLYVDHLSFHLQLHYHDNEMYYQRSLMRVKQEEYLRFHNATNYFGSMWSDSMAIDNNYMHILCLFVCDVMIIVVKVIDEDIRLSFL